MHFIAFPTTVQFLQVPVKALVFCEEGAVREVAIQNAHGVMFV